MIYRWVHQLKTPLSVIRLISENKKGDSDFSKIAHSASQIQYDLDQVLNMYKRDEIKNDFHSEKVNLNSVCKDCINELKSSFITKGIFPKLAVREELVVYSDSKWLRFVLYQLLTNALKYSNEGGKIVICAENRGGIPLSCIFRMKAVELIPVTSDGFMICSSPVRMGDSAENPVDWVCIW